MVPITDSTQPSSNGEIKPASGTRPVNDCEPPRVQRCIIFPCMLHSLHENVSRTGMHKFAQMCNQYNKMDLDKYELDVAISRQF